MLGRVITDNTQQLISIIYYSNFYFLPKLGPILFNFFVIPFFHGYIVLGLIIIIIDSYYRVQTLLVASFDVLVTYRSVLHCCHKNCTEVYYKSQHIFRSHFPFVMNNCFDYNNLNELCVSL